MKKATPDIRWGGVLAGLAALGCLAPTAAAQAAVMTTLYVSPTGAATACTQATPCSLQAAQTLARGMTSGMGGDIVIQLAGGTYTLSTGLQLTSADSGRNGFSVIYQAAPGATPVISGGVTVPASAWTLHDAAKNIWKASIPRNLLARQIYVDGTVARLARQSASVLGQVTQQPRGTAAYDYVITNPAIATWPRVTDLEFGWMTGGMRTTSHNAWLDAACKVSAVTATTVKLQPACYAIATAPRGTDGNAISANVNTPTHIENHYNLLGNPNQFYIDPTATASNGTLYYVPPTGTTMAGKTVVIPAVQTLLEGGSASDPIQNVTITGLNFQHATWVPSDANGFTPWQANNLVFGDTTLPSIAMLPAAVSFHRATNVNFTRNVITRVGGGGVSFDGGGSNNTIVGNAIYEVASNGIQVGTGPWYTAPPVMETGYLIANNYVHTVATHYMGGVGIFAGVVARTSIVHNEVWNTPYTGISLGWGWNEPNPAYPMVDNHIDYNYVHDTATSAMFDGGGLYAIGPQGASPAPTMTGNWVDRSASRSNFIYLDGGSTNWRVSSNVVTGVPPHDAQGLWLWVNYNGGQGGKGNIISGNFTNDTVPYDSPDLTFNTFTNNQIGLTTLPQAALAIQQAAGLEPAYQAIRGGPVQVNLAYRAAASSSSTYSSGTQADKANNGDTWSGWSASATDPAAYWQVDLGASYPLSLISINTRVEWGALDQPETRRNFTVLASNSPTMANAVTVCSQGPLSLPYKSKLDCPFSGTYRYVRVAKTDKAYFFLGEVYVYGARNLARGAAVTPSSVYGTNWAAAKAVDGDAASGWSPTASDTKASLQVDLGSAKSISTVQLTTRQEIDQPQTRRNFSIRVANTSSAADATVACTQGATSLPFKAVYTCALPPGNWRYVTATKTDGDYFYITELAVY